MANAPYYTRGHHQFANVANAHDVDQYAALYTDHQSSETPIASLEENHNFVELLEAATTAAGQASLAMDMDSAASSGRGKRKRVSSSLVDEEGSGQVRKDRASGSKRARTDAPTDPQLHGDDGVEHGRCVALVAEVPQNSIADFVPTLGQRVAAYRLQMSLC
jgi:hypothetical protein